MTGSDTGGLCRRPVRIVGVRSGVGGRDQGASAGADALKAAGLAAHLAAEGRDVAWAAILRPARRHAGDPRAAAARLAPRIAQAVRDAAIAGALPFVIGGDHSCAVGTWSGVHAAVKGRGALGLLWVDAHLDSHTPQTSHTGLLYGMPLASLLGYGEPEFTRCMNPEPKLLPRHVCVFGARSYEPEEQALLDRVGVRVIGMAQIERRGVSAALDEALAIVRSAPGGYGITIDVDALDPRDAPGVGTPAPGGLRVGTLVEALGAVADDGRLRALEICEYNPGRDRRGLTQRNVFALAGAVLGLGAGTDRIGAGERVA